MVGITLVMKFFTKTCQKKKPALKSRNTYLYIKKVEKVIIYQMEVKVIVDINLLMNSVRECQKLKKVKNNLKKL